MGNNQSKNSYFSKKDWVEVGSNSNNVTLWQNTSNSNLHMEQYRIYTTDSDELNHQSQLFYHRKNHPRWVAAYFFHEQNSDQFCVTRSVANIFVEKIPLRICDLKDLPLPDLIHCFDQSLIGYKDLAKLIGYFRVYSEYIGINQRGIVKVWAGPYWSQIGVIGNRLSEEEMVWSVIECLSSCIEKPSEQNSFFSIKNYLYRNTDRLNFDQAIYQLHSLAGKYNNNIIPSRLESLYDTNNFDMFLDPLLKSNHDLQNSYHRIDSHQPLEAKYKSRIDGVSISQGKERDFGPTFRKVEKPIQIYTSTNAVPRQLNISGNIPFQQRYPEIQMKKVNSREDVSGRLQIGQRFNNKSNLGVNYSEPKLITSTNYPLKEEKEIKQGMSKLASSVRFQFASPSTQNLQTHTINQSNGNYQSPFQIQPNRYQHSQSFGALNIVNQGYYAQKPINKHTFTIPPPRQTQLNITHNQTIPQSIIMKLYNSDQEEPLKKFGKVKRAESRVDQPIKRFDSFSIKDNQQYVQNNGINNNQLISPFNRLQSIQELSSENWKNDSNSYNSTPIKQAHNAINSQPQTKAIQNQNSIYQQNAYNYNNMLDPNDGKTSETLLNQLRQLNTNHRNHSQSQYGLLNNFQHPYQQIERENQHFQKTYTFSGDSYQRINDDGIQRYHI